MLRCVCYLVCGDSGSCEIVVVIHFVVSIKPSMVTAAAAGGGGKKLCSSFPINIVIHQSLVRYSIAVAAFDRRREFQTTVCTVNAEAGRCSTASSSATDCKASTYRCGRLSHHCAVIVSCCASLESDYCTRLREFLTMALEVAAGSKGGTLEVIKESTRNQ
jgi:hypothetical protein